jgi:hypothetical protein
VNQQPQVNIHLAKNEPVPKALMTKEKFDVFVGLVSALGNVTIVFQGGRVVGVVAR